MNEIKSSIAKAFIQAQKEMGDAKKDNINPYFKSKYADLNAVREACLPALNKHNIAVIQPIVQIEGKNFVKTILLHESGETIESLTEILFSKSNDPQAQGSGITYARRYGLQALVNIGAEDDDGNKASERPKNKFGINPNGELANGTDMLEVMNEKNESDFKAVKSILENCGGLEELSEKWKENTKIINSLKKYRSDLYSLLIDCKDEMKKSLEEK